MHVVGSSSWRSPAQLLDLPAGGRSVLLRRPRYGGCRGGHGQSCDDWPRTAWRSSWTYDASCLPLLLRRSLRPRSTVPLKRPEKICSPQGALGAVVSLLFIAKINITHFAPESMGCGAYEDVRTPFSAGSAAPSAGFGRWPGRSAEPGGRSQAARGARPS